MPRNLFALPARRLLHLHHIFLDKLICSSYCRDLHRISFLSHWRSRGSQELQEDVIEMVNSCINSPHKAQPIISCSDLDTHKEPSCGEECNVAKDSYSLVIAVNRDGCIGASDGSCLAMFHQAAPWGVGTNIFATNQGQEMLPDGSCAVDVESQELEGGVGCVRRGWQRIWSYGQNKLYSVIL